MIRVMIADDHQIVVDGIRALLENIQEIELVGTAADGTDLIDQLEKAEADVVLMDINMPRMDGLAATQYLSKKHSEVAVLVLSMHDSSSHIQQLIKAGAKGYILKNTQQEELEKAIRTVAKGESYFSSLVKDRIMEGLQSQEKAKKAVGNVKLTEREIEVLRLIVEEKTTHEIAEELFISSHTVESHRKNLLLKLGVRSSAGLVKYAIQSGLAD